MNKQGIEFIQNTNKKFKEIVIKNDLKFSEDYFSHSRIYERMMRCGIEKRIFEIDNESELEQVALATLREDVINKFSGK